MKPTEKLEENSESVESLKEALEHYDTITACTICNEKSQTLKEHIQHYREEHT